MFKESDVKKWFGKLDTAFSNLEGSISDAGDEIEDYLIERTNSTTPTDTRALINSRRLYQNLDSDSLEVEITYNEDGSAPYAITEHNDPYGHDYEHNSPEVRARSGQPALYVYIPLVQERDEWEKKAFSKIGWKK